jgi:hypothetical protein
MFILSFIFFIIAIGFLYTYFSTKSTRIHGVILISIGMILLVILYIVGKIWIAAGGAVPWWTIFKIEGFFADLGAFFGIMTVIGIIMVIIIQTDRIG